MVNSHALNATVEFLQQRTNDEIDAAIDASETAWWEFIRATESLTGAILKSPPFNDYGGGSGYAVAVGLSTARLMRARIEQLFDLMAFYE